MYSGMWPPFSRRPGLRNVSTNLNSQPLLLACSEYESKYCLGWCVIRCVDLRLVRIQRKRSLPGLLFPQINALGHYQHAGFGVGEREYERDMMILDTDWFQADQSLKYERASCWAAERTWTIVYFRRSLLLSSYLTTSTSRAALVR